MSCGNGMTAGSHRVPIMAKADDDSTVLLAEDGLVYGVARVEVRQHVRHLAEFVKRQQENSSAQLSRAANNAIACELGKFPYPSASTQLNEASHVVSTKVN